MLHQIIMNNFWTYKINNEMNAHSFKEWYLFLIFCSNFKNIKNKIYEK